ncbi:hypothetical protein AURDEDRAFT_90687 [Auricularia subglabra TFB-10046 SS5]|uniref:EI24-domain-containing protein n=1 Tax=Auricularia subglabra (strain TFB-10046 / SS5) TaxID=717982 RepID=J0DCT5_AURST|nr:hypothetical protein AURDEDRAFT_90687 [Auricularia subglabra TFB-10046 SS5]
MSSLAAASRQFVSSNAYQYPIKGIFHLLHRKELWPPVTKRILPCLALSTAVLVVMFSLAYLPQVAVLALFNGPLAFVNAAGLVLSESSFIVNQLARAFIIEDSLIDLFDATLIERDCASLVSRGRELKSGRKNAYQRLGKLVVSPLQRLSPQAIAMYLVSLPLNLIPVVGTAIFIILQGRRSGPGYHARYFQLKGMTPNERKTFIERNRGAYTSFGTAAALLGLVPFVSIPLAFSNSVGAALWAADLEKGPGCTQHTKPSELSKQDREL